MRLGDEFTQDAALDALGMLTLSEARGLANRIAAAPAVERMAYEAERRAFAAVVAQLGLSAPEQSPAPSVRSKLLARIAHEPVAARRAPTPFVVRAEEGEWKRINEGAFVKRLYVNEAHGTVTSLIKLLPGGRLAPHRHRAVEECYIIAGDYHINGEVFGPGDYHCALPGSIDEELYSEGGTLFLLVAPRRYEPLAPAASGI